MSGQWREEGPIEDLQRHISSASVASGQAFPVGKFRSTLFSPLRRTASFTTDA